MKNNGAKHEKQCAENCRAEKREVAVVVDSWTKKESKVIVHDCNPPGNFWWQIVG